jgi:hypothetical protein
MLRSEDPTGSIPARAEFSSRIVKLQPQKACTVQLGTYEEGRPGPEFEITTDPEMSDQIGRSLEELEIPGSKRYMLMYHLNNYGDRPCNVTVRRISSTSEAN